MMTMLHIIETLEDFGGTPRKLLYLTKYVDRDQCKLVFLLFRPASRNADFKSLENEFMEYGATILKADTTSPLKLAGRIGVEADRFRADVISTHYTRALVSGFIAAKSRGLPLIHHEHSSANYRKGMGRVMARVCLPRTDAVICNSKYTLNTIRASYPTASRKLHIIYNPVEERVVGKRREKTREQMGAKQDDILIGHVGGMIPQRDQETLIKAFYQIHSEFQNTKLLMIGDGPIRPSLEGIVQKLGLGKDVIFTGYTPAVGEYLAALDIYVNPTLDEGFGIAVVEAMLAKLPVVLSNRGAHPELILEGESGFLYPGGEAEPLAKGIRQLIKHPEKRREIGTKAYEYAKQVFAPSVYVSNYIRLVENVLGSSRATRSLQQHGPQWN